MDNEFRLILFIAPLHEDHHRLHQPILELSFVVGMVTDLEMCTQETPNFILALYVMMAGE